MLKVEVYRNLHIRDRVAYSIRSAKTKRVIDRKSVVYLCDVTFKVSKAGRAKVLKEKRKNVHAFICGYETDLNDVDLKNYKKVRVKYNPYFYDSFVDMQEKPITSASYVTIEGNQIFAYFI